MRQDEEEEQEAGAAWVSEREQVRGIERLMCAVGEAAAGAHLASSTPSL